ncbi:MAG: alginate export family protein [Hyphomonadaceae bacterium]
MRARPKRRAARTAGALLAASAAFGVAHAEEGGPVVELSGVARVMGGAWDGLPLGPAAAAGDESPVFLRLLAGVRAAWPEGTALELELGFHEQTGRRAGPASIDASSLDVTQAYLDLPVLSDVAVRLGRQHVVLGAKRFFALRDGTNISRAYDGALLDYAGPKLRVRAFAIHPVRIGFDPFDDSTERALSVFGVYATYSRRPDEGVDLYAFETDKNRSFYAQGVGGETRYTLGARFFDAHAPFDWDLEIAGQGGHFKDQDIAAWMAAGTAGYRFENARWAPRLGVRATIASGDSDPADGAMETFNPFFADIYLLGQASLIAPLNYAAVQPSVELRLSPNASLLVRTDWFWRLETADAIYLGGPAPTPVGPSGHFGAIQFDVEYGVNVRPDVRLSFGYTHMAPGQALRAVGGEDTDAYFFGMKRSF